MPGVLHDLPHGARLHEPPAVHDRDPVRDLDRDPHVVGHEDDGHPELALKLPQQEEDLDLHRRVEGGGRLVGEEQARPAREGKGDHRPLAHPPGELVRVGAKAAGGRRDPYPLEEIEGPASRLRTVHPFVANDRLGDLPSHRVHRIERDHRLLEDHPHVSAAQVGEVPFAHREDVAPPDLDATRENGTDGAGGGASGPGG